MPDNVVITTGGDATVATDQIGTVHYQKIKVVDGRADSDTGIPGDATNGLLVDVSRIAGNVSAVGTVTAEAKGTVTAEVKGTLTATLPFNSAFLISGWSATGTAAGMDSRPYSVGFVWGQISGNSASATILASDDSANWMVVTSIATGGNAAVNPFSAQLNAYYPYLAGRVDWVSANAGVTATVWMRATRA